jgi:rSAM/selenodomain-associated transferase 1
MDEKGPTRATERCLIMMAKFPRQGHVKTRLADEVGDRHACELYTRFVLDLLQTLPSREWSFRLALYPWERKRDMVGIIGKDVIQIPQRGNDLGERMGNIFTETFAEGFMEVVMIGSDVPDLPPEFIDEAFLALAEHDAVLGPACDGGYYLVGFRREDFRDPIFDDLPWGTPEIFTLQMKRFREQGLRVYILPPWEDVDTLADLAILANLAGATPFAESLTMKYLLSTNLLRTGKAEA